MSADAAGKSACATKNQKWIGCPGRRTGVWQELTGPAFSPVFQLLAPAALWRRGFGNGIEAAGRTHLRQGGGRLVGGLRDHAHSIAVECVGASVQFSVLVF